MRTRLFAGLYDLPWRYVYCVAFVTCLVVFLIDSVYKQRAAPEPVVGVPACPRVGVAPDWPSQRL